MGASGRVYDRELGGWKILYHQETPTQDG